jgi:hypothetical protein
MWMGDGRVWGVNGGDGIGIEALDTRARVSAPEHTGQLGGDVLGLHSSFRLT